MFFDGSFTLNGSGAGVVLIAPTGEKLRYAIELDFRATNNMAEYEALLAGLKEAAELGIRKLNIYGDSQLIINQINKGYQCTDPQMTAYLIGVRNMEKKFEGLDVYHVPRIQNGDADELAQLAARRQPLP